MAFVDPEEQLKQLKKWFLFMLALALLKIGHIFNTYRLTKEQEIL